DEGSVVSVNSHFPVSASLLDSSYLSKLEGSWTATNAYKTYKRSQSSKVSEAVTNSVQTTLIVDIGSNADPACLFTVTVETRVGGGLTERHPYFAEGMNLGGSTFIELNPGFSPMQRNYLPVWWLMRVQKKEDGNLEVARWNEAWLRTLLERKPRTLRHALKFDKDGLIVLTDSSEAIQRFLRRQASKPEAFEVTTFHPGGGEHWPAAALKGAVRDIAGGLDFFGVRETPGKGKVLIQVSDIVNQTAERIDTSFMSSILQNQIGSSSQFFVLNQLSYLDSNFSKDIAHRIAEATLSGTITKAQIGDGGTNSKRCVLRLTLRNRQDKILWENEGPLESLEAPTR
ncbi:MAG: hypothetical protein WCL11_28550, partial [Verrucomicrobiota bacterium]